MRSISPNYAFPGDLVDIFVDGDNLSQSKVNFSSSSFELVDISNSVDLITVNINEETKPGTYTLNVSGQRVNFYVAAKFDPNIPPPELFDIFIKDEELGLKQMTEIGNSGTFKDLKLRGRNLLAGDQPPIIIPDIKGVNLRLNLLLMKNWFLI